ncbi:phage integrase SAM-like domain-containing protein [Hymenobacter sp. BT523]|uniref:tyrosine-type recombinase/integrase n=1 Tax=Hymenobacter sp. BT523 TaxID=2795725 RepID=UPI0018EB6ABB|nr:phage integrase SAM-like domain-containing protein [Hymenobacter sp. BT523]MBJ6110009.1 phage integrase SAM-like domain-containing protein [Hymenobacter sp. BT523]
MSKITFILRPANAKGECPVSIKHKHSTLTPFTKKTGVSVPPQYFDKKTGKVSNRLPSHVKDNAKIEQVRADIELAAFRLERSIELRDRAGMSKAYDDIVSSRIKLDKNYRTMKAGYEDLAEQLRHEIAELKSQLEEKQIELRDYEMILGNFDGKLLKAYVHRYRDTQKITDNTKRAYTNLARYITGFNQFWEITDVNPDTLIGFENYLISLGLNNSSTNQYVKRAKTVVLKYADVLQINKQPIKDHRAESKQLRKQDVLFLSTEELNAFKELEVPKRREVVKDSFLLMCATGLRFSDSQITPNQVVGKFIVLTTKKTNTLVKIPLNDTAKAILAKYKNEMPYQYLPNFSRVLKALAKQAGIDELVYNAKRVGTEIIAEYVPKHTLISAHVGRKTFISHSLASGVNPAVLKQWIGHSKMELMFSNYASGAMNTVEEMNKVSSI